MERAWLAPPRSLVNIEPGSDSSRSPSRSRVSCVTVPLVCQAPVPIEAGGPYPHSVIDTLLDWSAYVRRPR